MAASLQFCRINLLKTNYSLQNYSIAHELTENEKRLYWDEINQIYRRYCEYKKFDSVLPLWQSQFQSNEYIIIGYFYQDRLTAWTKLRILDNRNIESDQFAWDYIHPYLRLGHLSLQYECAYFKTLGYNYLWLGSDDHYKQKIQGYETVGKLL
jgi:hypothetical protein